MSTTPSMEMIRPWEARDACCPRREPIMTVQRLSVRYHGNVALDDVNLVINRGCILAIVGPSGCGKSTFLSSLNRMTDLIPGCTVTGEIRLAGENIHAPGT